MVGCSPIELPFVTYIILRHIFSTKINQIDLKIVKASHIVPSKIASLTFVHWNSVHARLHTNFVKPDWKTGKGWTSSYERIKMRPSFLDHHQFQP